MCRPPRGRVGPVAGGGCRTGGGRDDGGDGRDDDDGDDGDSGGALGRCDAVRAGVDTGGDVAVVEADTSQLGVTRQTGWSGPTEAVDVHAEQHKTTTAQITQKRP